MKIYRLFGHSSKPKSHGMLHIDPVVSTTLAPVKRKAKALAKKSTKDGLQFRFYLQKVTVKKIGLPEVVQLFKDEDTTSLIEQAECIEMFTNPDYPDDMPF